VSSRAQVIDESFPGSRKNIPRLGGVFFLFFFFFFSTPPTGAMGFSQGWVAGVRGELSPNENSRFTEDSRSAIPLGISANLARYPDGIENKLRLQYNHDFWSRTSFSPIAKSLPFFCKFEGISAARGAQVLKHGHSREHYAVI